MRVRDMLSYNFAGIIIRKMEHDRAGNPSVAATPTPRRRAGRGLAYGLVEDFSRKIQQQHLRPGDRLPTEAEIVQAYGVSRTVVREAISRLQAGGWVETHHGIGTFVLAPKTQSMFALDPSELAAAVDVIAVLELRISLETESAGLAAVRRSGSQLQAMRSALDRLELEIAGQGDGAGADFAFHLQIAEATGNGYFADIMRHLGNALIPRTRLSTLRPPVRRSEYLGRVNREHEEIYAAIARGDAESARAAMRIHLTNSRERWRLARQAAEDSTASLGAPAA